jgi:ribonuclease HI
MAGKKYYAVAAGRQPGIYTQWFGETGAHAQVDGYKGARYKGFATIEGAQDFMCGRHAEPEPKKRRSSDPQAAAPSGAGGSQRIVIYTDGSSLGNPGPGGYGAVIAANGDQQELSGGFRRTTNNRMELLACIVSLEQLETPAAVDLYTDSRYVADGMTKGWARTWKRNGWHKSNGTQALNIDLWERLLSLCNRHDVNFIWVRGHAGNPGNERCDKLATQAAAQPNLPADNGYEG